MQSTNNNQQPTSITNHVEYRGSTAKKKDIKKKRAQANERVREKKNRSWYDELFGLPYSPRGLYLLYTLNDCIYEHSISYRYLFYDAFYARFFAVFSMPPSLLCHYTSNNSRILSVHLFDADIEWSALCFCSFDDAHTNTHTRCIEQKLSRINVGWICSNKRAKWIHQNVNTSSFAPLSIRTWTKKNANEIPRP